MNRLPFVATRRATILILLVFVLHPMVGQDLAKVSPDKVRVLLENDNVRVLEVRLTPGETLGGHSHVSSVVYFLTDCKIRSTVPGGNTAVAVHKAGETAWRGPLKHLEENVGKTEARALIIEMKSVQEPSEKAVKEPSKEVLISIQANKDAIINDLNNFSAQVYQYRIRPRTMGGGQGSYHGFSIAPLMTSNQNAAFAADVVDSNHVRFAAISALGYGTIHASVNEFGVLANWEYAGAFKGAGKAPEVGPGENRDAMINDLNNLAAVSYQYRIRPKSMGGGEGKYTGFQIPQRMLSNENGTYSAEVINGDRVRFMAISIYGYGVIRVEIDENGRLNNWYYTDKFQ